MICDGLFSAIKEQMGWSKATCKSVKKSVKGDMAVNAIVLECIGITFDVAPVGPKKASALAPEKSEAQIS